MRADAKIPVVSWGGELVNGIVATTSALKVGQDSVDAMLKDFGDQGQVLALTYHTGVLCLYRGMAFDKSMKAQSGIKVTSNEVAIPGQVQDGTKFTAAWPSSPEEEAGDWALWGPGRAGDGCIAGEAAGRTDVKTYSINGSPQALQAVKNGTMTQIIWQDGYTEGRCLRAADAR